MAGHSESSLHPEPLQPSGEAKHHFPGECLSSSGQRDLLPVPTFVARGAVDPDLPRHAKRRFVKTAGHVEWANAGLRSLNELHGDGTSVPPHTQSSAFGNAPFLCSTPGRTSVSPQQHLCRQRLLKSYQAMGSPPDVSDAGALSELCIKCIPGYTDGERSTLRPYSKDSVSWPPRGYNPVPLAEAVRGGDRKWIGQWQRHLLRPEDEAKQLREMAAMSKEDYR